MKNLIKKTFSNNWLLITMFLVIQLKSMILLAMLRSPGSKSISLSKMYFSVPAIGAHLLIILLIFSLTCIFKFKTQLKVSLIINLLISLLFIFDIWYYRANGSFVSLRHLIHPEIFNPTNKSLFNFQLVDLLFIIDFIIFALLNKITDIFNFRDFSKLKNRLIKAFSLFFICISLLYISHIQIDINKGIKGINLFSLSWAPYQTYSDMSPLGYHGYDIAYTLSKDFTLRDAEIKEINDWFENNKEDLEDNNYFSILKGKNLIALQVESLENFVIGQKVYDMEITPTLNKLLKNSIYFNNIYEQNNSGTSSDADFLVNTSIFPIREGAAFQSYPWTKYKTLQNILEKVGYSTISTHAEISGNWNWAENHKAFGADKILDINSYNLDEVIGLGLSDESFLRQVAGKIKDESTPFYTFVTTLTSHGPFEIPEDKKLLNLPKELDENILGAYFQSIRYTDEAIKLFLEELERNNLLENTVVMIYGDHTGVHKFYEEEMEDAPLEGNWWKENDMKIPLIIYNPEIKGETITKAGGQVDFLPTISYLLGIERKEFENTSMGRVLVNTNRDYTILNNGEIIGTPSRKEELENLENTYKIADYIIKGNYFN